MKKIILLLSTLIISFLIGWLLHPIYGYFIAFLSIIFYLLNSKLKKNIRYINKDLIHFMEDPRRNFDTLIIGQPLLPNDKIEGNSRLTFTHNKRSLFASYLYLIHNYSYLREDGKAKVYIIISNMQDSMSFTIFDIYSFHRVIKMRLKVNSILINRLPILFYFKKFNGSLFFLDQEKIDLKERIETFCRERNLNLTFIYHK